MIRIKRGAEPPALTAARRKHLARACLAWAQGASASGEKKAGEGSIEFDGYGVARKALHIAQDRKCAYCERQEGLLNQPVEHFRPKAGALRGDPLDESVPRTTDPDHYFWLAWSWENLFFACGTCNGGATKQNWFPLLDDGTKPPVPERRCVVTLPPACFDRTLEKPMLVDPSFEDPMGFIKWLPLNPDAPWESLRWFPQGIDLERRGRATVRILGLDQDLPEQVSDYLRCHVTIKMRRLQRHKEADDRAAAQQVWDELDQVLAKELPYLAAVYDAIDWFLLQPDLTDTEAFLGRQLRALRPGASDADVPSKDIEDPPELSSLSDELILRVRAENWNAEEAVLALCSSRPWDDASVLARILDYAEATVISAGRALVQAGKLVRLKQGGFGPVRVASARPAKRRK